MNLKDQILKKHFDIAHKQMDPYHTQILNDAMEEYASEKYKNMKLMHTELNKDFNDLTELNKYLESERDRLLDQVENQKQAIKRYQELLPNGINPNEGEYKILITVNNDGLGANLLHDEEEGKPPIYELVGVLETIKTIFIKDCLKKNGNDN